MEFRKILKQIRLQLTYQKLNSLLYKYMKELQQNFAQGKITLGAYHTYGILLGMIADSTERV